MSLTVRFLFLVVAAGVLFALLRQYQPQTVPLFSVAAILVLVMFLIAQEGEVFIWLAALDRLDGDEQGFCCLLKSAVILLCSDWCREFCKECGMASLAGGVELTGRCFALSAAFPLFTEAYNAVMRLTV